MVIRFTRENDMTYFSTLNAALASENLVDLWPLGSNIPYGETVRHLVEVGTYGKTNKPEYRLISVYRNNEGRYETPTHYSTK